LALARIIFLRGRRVRQADELDERCHLLIGYHGRWRGRKFVIQRRADGGGGGGEVRARRKTLPLRVPFDYSDSVEVVSPQVIEWEHVAGERGDTACGSGSDRLTRGSHYRRDVQSRPLTVTAASHGAGVGDADVPRKLSVVVFSSRLAECCRRRGGAARARGGGEGTASLQHRRGPHARLRRGLGWGDTSPQRK